MLLECFSLKVPGNIHMHDMKIHIMAQLLISKKSYISINH